MVGASDSLIIRDNVGYNPKDMLRLRPPSRLSGYIAGNSPEDLYISGGVAPKLSLEEEVFSETPHMVHLEPNHT